MVTHHQQLDSEQTVSALAALGSEPALIEIGSSRLQTAVERKLQSLPEFTPGFTIQNLVFILPEVR